jgi:hypothetical protein
MKCFIAIDEDLLLKLWMLDPQLVAPFSQADMPKKNDTPRDSRSSQYQITRCHLTIEDGSQSQSQSQMIKNTVR